MEDYSSLVDMIMRYKKFPQSNDYDMRGFTSGYLNADPAATIALDPNDNRVHFTDKWKLPNHPSFSAQSQYSKKDNDPNWEGGDSSWVLRKPNGEAVAYDLPFLQGPTPKRKREIGDYSDWGIDNPKGLLEYLFGR
jgi:hypothetical protein